MNTRMLKLLVISCLTVASVAASALDQRELRGSDPRVLIKPEDELNLAVYSKTAEELLREPASGSGITSDLEAFPRALTRHMHQS